MTAIIFDIDNTMYDRKDSIIAAALKAFSGHGEFHTEALFRAFTRRSDEFFEASMKNLITVEEMRILRISKAMEDIGITVTKEEAMQFLDAYAYEQTHLKLNPDLEKAVRMCYEAEIRTGVITNGLSDYQRAKVASLGLDEWIAPETVIASGDIGYNKPDPEIFHYAEQKLGLIPEDTWYVGDSYEHDIEAAHAVGWHTVWLRKKHETPEENVADFTADKTAQIPGIIAKILSASQPD